jgi:hypothetical protein
MSHDWKIHIKYFPFPNEEKRKEAYERFVESFFHTISLKEEKWLRAPEPENEPENEPNNRTKQ